MLNDLMEKYDVKVHEYPSQIRYYKDKIIQSMYLRIILYPLYRLTYNEGLIRNKGFITKEKWKQQKGSLPIHSTS